MGMQAGGKEEGEAGRWGPREGPGRAWCRDKCSGTDLGSCLGVQVDGNSVAVGLETWESGVGYEDAWACRAGW